MKTSVSRYLIITIISLCVSFLLYGNTIPGQFVYDDSFFSKRTDMSQPGVLLHAFVEPYNPSNTNSGGGFYRPLWVISLACNYLLFGNSPVSFHVVNILLYAGTLVLLYYILNRLLHNDLLSVCIVVLFAVLPIHTEVVANIKSRDELLSVFLLLASYVLFIRTAYTKGAKTSTVGSALLYGLALLSKESVVLGPIIFILVYRLSFKSNIRYLLRLLIPYMIVLSLAMGMRYVALGDDAFLKDQARYILNPLKDAPLGVRLSTAMKIAGIYLTKTVIPYNLTASYDFNHIPLISQPFASWEPIVGIMGLTVMVYLALRGTAYGVQFGAIWFLIAYLINSKLLFTKGALMGERLLYMPSIGLSMLYGYALYLLCQKRTVYLIPVLSLIALAYTAVILPRNLVWLDPQKFFEQMAIDSPNSAQAHKALADGYFDMGKLAYAQIHAQRAYEIYKNDEEVLVLLGKLSYISGDFSGCMDWMNAAIAIKKSQYDANHFRMLCLIKLGRYDEAIDLAKKRLQIVPSDMNIRFVMAAGLYKLGRREEALSERYIWSRDISPEERENIMKEF